MKKGRVKLPGWMDNYLPLIRWHEGHSIEAILNDEIDIPLWRELAVKAQIELLEDLKDRGMLVQYFYNGYESGGRRSFEDM